jgi:hypothetical protein
MSKLTRDETGNVCQFGETTTNQVITVSTSSQQSTALGSQTTIVRIAASGSAAYFSIGSNPTANLTTSPILVANDIEYVEVSPGDKIAVIGAAAGGFFSITEIS